MIRFFILLCSIMLSVNLYGQQLNVSSTGVVNFNHGFTINEAGLDFQNSIVSSNDILLNVEYVNRFNYFLSPDKKWRITVKRTDVNWNKDLSVEVRRAGSGNIIWAIFSARRPLSGGTNYIAVREGIEYVFFEGEHGYANIPINVNLVGASVAMGAGDYSTTIYFTVHDQ